MSPTNISGTYDEALSGGDKNGVKEDRRSRSRTEKDRAQGTFAIAKGITKIR
jgi:hypothetical protein